DFYAGSGALGLEALSRGASHVTLVEADRQAAQVIRKNVEAWGIDGAYRVVECAVEKSCSALAPAAPLDLVLADPSWKISAARAALPPPVPLRLVLADRPRKISAAAAGIVLQVVKISLSPSAVVVLGHASRDDLRLEAGSGPDPYGRPTWGVSPLSFFRQPA